jgi:hypothetical protein
LYRVDKSFILIFSFVHFLVNYTTVHDVIPMSGFFYFKLPTNQKWCTASESTPGAAAAATATTIDTTTATITTTAAAAAAANIITVPMSRSLSGWL